MKLIKLKLKYKIYKYDVVPLLPPRIRIFMNGEFPISFFFFICLSSPPLPLHSPFRKKPCYVPACYAKYILICRWFVSQSSWKYFLGIFRSTQDYLRFLIAILFPGGFLWKGGGVTYLFRNYKVWSETFGHSNVLWSK